MWCCGEHDGTFNEQRYKSGIQFLECMGELNTDFALQVMHEYFARFFVDGLELSYDRNRKVFSQLSGSTAARTRYQDKEFRRIFHLHQNALFRFANNVFCSPGENHERRSFVSSGMPDDVSLRYPIDILPLRILRKFAFSISMTGDAISPKYENWIRTVPTALYMFLLSDFTPTGAANVVQALKILGNFLKSSRKTPQQSIEIHCPDAHLRFASLLVVDFFANKLVELEDSDSYCGVSDEISLNEPMTPQRTSDLSRTTDHLGISIKPFCGFEPPANSDANDGVLRIVMDTSHPAFVRSYRLLESSSSLGAETAEPRYSPTRDCFALRTEHFTQLLQNDAWCCSVYSSLVSLSDATPPSCRPNRRSSVSISELPFWNIEMLEDALQNDYFAIDERDGAALPSLFSEFLGRKRPTTRAVWGQTNGTWLKGQTSDRCYELLAKRFHDRREDLAHLYVQKCRSANPATYTTNVESFIRESGLANKKLVDRLRALYLADPSQVLPAADLFWGESGVLHGLAQGQGACGCSEDSQGSGCFYRRMVAQFARSGLSLAQCFMLDFEKIATEFGRFKLREYAAILGVQ
eukprot:c8909_g1_i2.p1 GENE.c8909_g1_i2~~c8909_g1_i2.p1  ORF type:complete len:580 (+),score=132.56 c8909_g1_i2:1437-3176(+)